MDYDDDGFNFDDPKPKKPAEKKQQKLHPLAEKLRINIIIGGMILICIVVVARVLGLY